MIGGCWWGRGGDGGRGGGEWIGGGWGDRVTGRGAGGMGGGGVEVKRHALKATSRI